MDGEREMEREKNRRMVLEIAELTQSLWERPASCIDPFSIGSVSLAEDGLTDVSVVLCGAELTIAI